MPYFVDVLYEMQYHFLKINQKKSSKMITFATQKYHLIFKIV